MGEENTGKEPVDTGNRSADGTFGIGNRANPNGRPTGSLNKYTLLKQKILDVFDEVKGKEKLKEMTGSKMGFKQFMSYVVALLPKDLNVDTDLDMKAVIETAGKQKEIESANRKSDG